MKKAKKVKKTTKYELIYNTDLLKPYIQQLETSQELKALRAKYSAWYTSDRVVKQKCKQFIKDYARIVRDKLKVPSKIEIHFYISDTLYLEEDLRPACFVDFSNVAWRIAGHNFKLVSAVDAEDEGPYYIRGWLNLKSLPPRSDDIEVYRRIKRIAECPELLFSKDIKMRELATEVIKGA